MSLKRTQSVARSAVEDEREGAPAQAILLRLAGQSEMERALRQSALSFSRLSGQLGRMGRAEPLEAQGERPDPSACEPLLFNKEDWLICCAGARGSEAAARAQSALPQGFAARAVPWASALAALQSGLFAKEGVRAIAIEIRWEGSAEQARALAGAEDLSGELARLAQGALSELCGPIACGRLKGEWAIRAMWAAAGAVSEEQSIWPALRAKQEGLALAASIGPARSGDGETRL